MNGLAIKKPKIPFLLERFLQCAGSNQVQLEQFVQFAREFQVLLEQFVQRVGSVPVDF